ncbi:MAG: oligosaccharide flippase family protein [Oscillospiraceae bacterium]|nr:oligosaccharide flippase family protein [Oscillospiraceae bacterium]
MGKGQREKGIVLSYVNMAVNFVIGIIFTPFMLRILSDSEYGLYSIASSVVAYLSLLDLGLGNSMIRFTAKYRAQGDKEGEERINGMFFAMFAVLGVLSLIIGAVLCLNMDIFFKRTFTPDELHRAKVIFLILLANACVSLVTTAFSAICNSHERFVFNRTFNLVTNIIKYSAEAIVLASGFQSVGMTVAAVTVSIASKAVPMWYCFKVIKAKFKFDKFDKEVFKSIMNYSFFIFINILVEQLYANTDKIILGSVIGTVAVAVYQVSANLQKDFSQFSSSIGGVFLPMLTTKVTNKAPMSEISKIFIRVSRIQFIVLSLIFCGFVLFGKSFIYYWAGENYIGAYAITLVLMAPSIIPLSQSLGVTLLQAMNRHRIRSIVYLLISIFNVAVSIPLAMKWSGFGAAIGTAIGNLLGQIMFMNYYYYKKIGLDIPGYWKNAFKIAVVMAVLTGAAGAIMHFVYKQSIPNMLIGIVLFVIAYIPVAWFFILNDEEKQMVRFVIDKIKSLFNRKKVKAEKS